MKKILSILFCCIILLGVTGCGSQNYNSEYEEEINIVRDMKVPAYSKTVGELLDNALEDEYWDKFTGYISNGSNYVLISVKGKCKYDDKEYEIVYEVDIKNKTVRIEDTIADGDDSLSLFEIYNKSNEELK